MRLRLASKAIENVVRAEGPGAFDFVQTLVSHFQVTPSARSTSFERALSHTSRWRLAEVRAVGAGPSASRFHHTPFQTQRSRRVP